MKMTKQFSFSLTNRPGELAKCCSSLTQSGINILAASVAETSEQSVLRLVVDKPSEVAKMLGECPMTITETDVLLLRLSDKVGMLSQLAEKLAAKKINLDFIYGSSSPDGGKQYMVVGATDIKAARKALPKSW
jgi:hypothetical protein